MAYFEDDRARPACPKCGDTDCVCPDDEFTGCRAAKMLSNNERNYRTGSRCPICGDTDCVCPEYEANGAANMPRNNKPNYWPGSNKGMSFSLATTEDI